MKDKTYIYGGVISSLVLVSVLGFNLITSDGLHVLLTAGFSIIHIFLTFKKLLPRIFFLLIPLLVLFYMLGSDHVLSLYRHIDWFDNIVHTLSGFIITLLIGIVLGKGELNSLRIKPWLFVLIITSLGLTVGVIWEIVEWGFDSYIRTDEMITVYDLITDLILDSIGALFAGILSFKLTAKEI